MTQERKKKGTATRDKSDSLSPRDRRSLRAWIKGAQALLDKCSDKLEPPSPKKTKTK